VTEALALSGVNALYGTATYCTTLVLAVVRAGAGMLGRNGAGQNHLHERHHPVSFRPGRPISLYGERSKAFARGDRAQGRRAGAAGPADIPTLTVRENLSSRGSGAPARPAWTLERVFDLFRGCRNGISSLRARCQAASSRCWHRPRSHGNPRVLLMDEPSRARARIVAEVGKPSPA